MNRQDPFGITPKEQQAVIGVNVDVRFTNAQVIAAIQSLKIWTIIPVEMSSDAPYRITVIVLSGNAENIRQRIEELRKGIISAVILPKFHPRR